MEDTNKNYDEVGFDDPVTFPDAYLHSVITMRKQRVAEKTRLRAECKPVRGFYADKIEIALLEELQQYRDAAEQLRNGSFASQNDAIKQLASIQPGVTLLLAGKGE